MSNLGIKRKKTLPAVALVLNDIYTHSLFPKSIICKAEIFILAYLSVSAFYDSNLFKI